MPRDPGAFDYDGTARKWLALANRQLLSLSELYRSGRWARYYASPEQFAAQMQQAIKAARVWARLADRWDESRKNELNPAE
jgi:hypothetical protein